MNKFVLSALAAPLISAAGLASDTEWPELDRELAALSNAPLTQDSGGPYLSGWLIGAFDYNADSESQFANGSKYNDDIGFGVRSARLEVEGTVAQNYGYKLGYDFFDWWDLYQPMRGTYIAANGMTAGITDAYGTVAVGDYVNFKLGIFNGPSLRSASIDRNKTLFIDRSYLGRQQSFREAGVMAYGNFDRVNWELSATNGWDGRSEGFGYGVRVDVDILGEMSDCEGAWGAQEGTNLNVGIAYVGDSSDNPDLSGNSWDAGVGSLDATLVTGAFTVWGEVASYDKNVGALYSTGGGGMNVVGTDVDNTPWSAGIAYLFGEQYEVGFRYDDLDVGTSVTANPNLRDATRFNFVVNRYIAGHDVKWQLEFGFGDSKAQSLSSSDKIGEHTVISIALALGF